MNKKAEAFQKYLDEKEIKAFTVQEIENDELHTAVFNSQMEIEGQMLPTLVILDDSIYGIVRVRVANSALKEANETALCKAINELNAHYKVFKYYFAPDGALILDAVVLDKPEEVDGDMVYTVINVIVNHLTQEYKNIMKSIWA